MNVMLNALKMFAVVAIATMGTSSRAETTGSVRYKELPEGYEPLESIRNPVWKVDSTTRDSDLAFIKTGIAPNDQVPEVYLKFQLHQVTTGQNDHSWIFGCIDDDTGKGTSVGNYLCQYRVRVDASDNGLYFGSPDTGIHELLMNAVDGTYFDGMKLSEKPANAKDTIAIKGGQYYLFARYERLEGQNFPQSADCSIYAAKISLDGELKRNYVPCRRLKDRVAGMYDLASGCFCPSDGGVAFVAGEAVAEKPFEIAALPPAKWVGESDGPVPEVRNSADEVLTRGSDYTLSWLKCDDGLFAYVIVTGQGAYAGYRQAASYSLLSSVNAVPAMYRPVQRVYSGGNAGGAFLKTGIHPDGQNPLEVHMKYRFNAQPQSDGDNDWIFGWMDDTPGIGVGMTIGYYKMKLRLRVGSTAAYCANGFQTGDHEIRFNTPTGTYIDDLTTPATLVDGDASIAGAVDQGSYDGVEYYLLARMEKNGGAPIAQPCAGSVYYAKIWQGGKLVRDYVPCRCLKDGVVGFYDLVTGVFCPSSGEEAFGAAPAENPYVDRDVLSVSMPESGKWIDETHGVEPVVVDAVSGKTLARGTDYDLAWMLGYDLKAHVLITGRGAYEGINQNAAYEPTFDHSALGTVFARAEFVEAVFNRELDGFEGARGALIRTGVVPNGAVPMVHVKAQMVGDVQKPIAHNTYFMGYYTDSPVSGLQIGPYNDGNTMKMRYRVGETVGFFNLTGESIGQVHEYKLNAPGGTIIDGINVGAPAGVADPLDGQNDLEYCLFGRSMYANGKQYDESSRCRIYFAKFYLDGEKVRDFVPCYVRALGIAGLFDKVTGRFFANANPSDGSLVAYVPCEYAEARATSSDDASNGACVKTGVVPKTGDRPTVEMTFKWNRNLHETWLFGYWNGSTGTSIGMNNSDKGKLTYRQRVGNTAGRYDRPGDPQPETANKHTIRFNTEDGTFLDGVKETDFDIRNATEPSGPMEYYLFARNLKENSIQTINGWTDARIYSFKLWMNGNPTLDLKPMKRFPTGDAVLYDSVAQRVLQPTSGKLYPGDVIEPRPSGLLILFF